MSDSLGVARKLGGQDAAANSNLDDEIAGPDLPVVDELSGERSVSEEVLAVGATPSVARKSEA